MHWVGIYINYKTKGQVLETKKMIFLLLLFLSCFPKNQIPKEEVWNNKPCLLDLRLPGSWNASSRSLPGPICRFYSVMLTCVPKKPLAVCLRQPFLVHSPVIFTAPMLSDASSIPRSSDGEGNPNHRECIKCLWQVTGASSTFFFTY